MRFGDETGATMVEYGLMVLLIALVAFATIQVFGLQVADLFQPIVDFFT